MLERSPSGEARPFPMDNVGRIQQPGIVALGAFLAREIEQRLADGRWEEVDQGDYVELRKKGGDGDETRGKPAAGSRGAVAAASGADTARPARPGGSPKAGDQRLQPQTPAADGVRANS